eukprot:g1690.t1 g1690   contig10:2588678-2589108(+)
MRQLLENTPKMALNNVALDLRHEDGEAYTIYDHPLRKFTLELAMRPNVEIIVDDSQRQYRITIAQIFTLKACSDMYAKASDNPIVNEKHVRKVVNLDTRKGDARSATKKKKKKKKS